MANRGFLPVRRTRSFEFLPPDLKSPKSGTVPPLLNLVLCGRSGAGKTSAAKAILGQTELHSASKISESVKNQGEVSGCWVSVVKLPALYGRSEQEVMEESFRCVSLCDPEGVHAFIQVLPVGPITDEDKGELQTIQDTFSPRVKDFTMILFTVESEPTDPDVGNFISRDRDIQELCQSCGGRYVVLNIKGRQQIPELLERVGAIKHSYTTVMFANTQTERVVQLQKEVEELKKKKTGALLAQRVERPMYVGYRTGGCSSSSMHRGLGYDCYDSSSKYGGRRPYSNYDRYDSSSMYGGRRPYYNYDHYDSSSMYRAVVQAHSGLDKESQ